MPGHLKKKGVVSVHKREIEREREIYGQLPPIGFASVK